MTTIQRATTASAVRVSLVRYAAIGAVLGLLWGAAMRGWMRFISTTPEFTWSGTGFILGSATLAGLALGFVEAARRSGRHRAWRVAGLLSVGVFGGAGLFMAPTALLGGFALSGRSRPAVRVFVGVLAIAPIVLLVMDLEPLPHSYALSAFIFVALAGVEALAFSVLFRRWAARTATSPAEPSP
jgi:hypothetical protein